MTYQLLRDLVTGEISPSTVMRSDGVPVFSGDPEPWAAYQAWLAAGNAPAQPAQAPPTPPPEISDRQFARGLWGDGIITYAEFLGFIGPGAIPGAIQAIVDQLADDDTGAPTPRKDAIGFLTGSKLYDFSHPLVAFFRQALAASDPKWTPDYLRAQWLAWSAL